MFCRPFQLAPIYFFAIVLFCVEGVKAESDTRNLRIHRWTTDDGLPQHRIACLKQTQDGYLWLGTWYGLVRFNRVSFTVFNEYNTPEFSDSTINALAEDTAGTLWIGTANGLLSYRDQRFRHYTTKDGLADPKISRLAAGSSGALWVQTDSSVVRFEKGRFSTPWKPKLPGRVIHFIEEGPDGWLDIFQEKAWVSLSPKGDQIRTNACVNSSVTWNAGIRAQGNSSMWAGTSNGLHFIEPGTTKTFSSIEMGGHPVSLLYQDKSTNVWAGTRPA